MSSKLRAVTIVVGPLLVLGTMAVGLRLGAEPPGVAAHVVAFPAPAANDRLVWQVRTFQEARRIREPASDMPFALRARGGGTEVRVSGKTNVEGIAEVELPLKTTPGMDVDVEVTSSGALLASGVVRTPAPIATHAPEPVRPTKTEGPTLIDVFVPPGGVPPSLDSSIRVRIRPPAGHSPSALKITAQGENGLDVTKQAGAPCPAGWVSIPVRAMGHVLGLNLEVSGADGARGSWFGALPVVMGGDAIELEPPHPPPDAPFVVRVRTPTSKPLVYVEILDEGGRVAAAPLPVTKGGGFGVAQLEAKGVGAGRYWVVASSRADGFQLGTAVAHAFAVGGSAAATCETEAELTLREPPSMARTIALDGFTLRRAEAAKIRRKGMTLAVISLAVGGLLAALMLLAPLRERAPTLEAEGLVRSSTPKWLIAAMLLGLSCLAYLLLAGLVLFSGS